MAEAAPQTANKAILHPIRLTLIASYIPALPLCITHALLSHLPVPAIGLLPLTFSFASSLAISRLRPELETGPRDDFAVQTPQAKFLAEITHPITIFALDTVLAAAYVVVVVSTWLSQTGNARLSMLAAYTTTPLLTNFLVHLFLAGLALYEGLAIRDVVNYIAWRAVPPECPDCQVRIIPHFPQLPWLRRLQQGDEFLPLLSNDLEQSCDGREHGALQPAAVKIIRKDRKGKSSTPAPSEDETGMRS